jgi:glycosyltransferase involved in cell wall biosynthesis
MKIAVISTPVFQLSPPNGLPGYGGLEVIAWERAKGLAERGHQVMLIAPDGSTCPGCQVIHTGPAGRHSEEQAYGGDKGRNYPGYWMHLLQADVVIDDSWQKHSYLLKMEGRLKAPVLGVCHAPVDTMMSKPPAVDKPCIVCISQDQAAHFKALFNRDARHAYNGIDLGYYKPLNVPRSDRFLFLARFSSIKGPQTACEAVTIANVGLDLIGDTQITGEPQLVETCRKIAVAAKPGQINIVGNATRGNAVWWMSQAHAFLHPAKTFREPFGLAPVEAQACGLPVICFDNGALRETTCPDARWMVRTEQEYYEAVREAGRPISDNTRRQCQEWATQFSIENMVSRYEQLCREAVDGGW